MEGLSIIKSLKNRLSTFVLKWVFFQLILDYNGTHANGTQELSMLNAINIPNHLLGEKTIWWTKNDNWESMCNVFSAQWNWTSNKNV
jgi:hypothetical protein